jgi:hypothetical protein
LFCLDFVGILLGCPATAFGAIEEVKPVTQVTMDSDGLPLRFPSVLFYDDATDETYVVTGGKGQFTVFADDQFPLATAGGGRGIYAAGGTIDRQGAGLHLSEPKGWQAIPDYRSERSLDYFPGNFVRSDPGGRKFCPPADGGKPRRPHLCGFATSRGNGSRQ